MMIGLRGGNRRGVAQPGSASALGAEGRRFESCLPDHLRKPAVRGLLRLAGSNRWNSQPIYFDLFSVVVVVLVVVLVCTSWPTLTSISALPTLFSILSPVF